MSRLGFTLKTGAAIAATIAGIALATPSAQSANQTPCKYECIYPNKTNVWNLYIN